MSYADRFPKRTAARKQQADLRAGLASGSTAVAVLDPDDYAATRGDGRVLVGAAVTPSELEKQYDQLADHLMRKHEMTYDESMRELLKEKMEVVHNPVEGEPWEGSCHGVAFQVPYGYSRLPKSCAQVWRSKMAYYVHYKRMLAVGTVQDGTPAGEFPEVKDLMAEIESVGNEEIGF